MTILITPKKIILIFLFVLIPAILGVGFFLTGYQYVPVEYTVGKCTKNFASKASYSEQKSELRSVDINVDDADALLCYGTVAAVQKDIYGNQIPYDEIWEFGANDPTRLYSNKDLMIGDVEVLKGRYSIYVVPGRWKWEVFISESINHKGENIDHRVREQEVGSFKIRPQYNPEFIEELTISSNYNEIVAELGKTRINIPVKNIDTGEEIRHTTILSKFWASL